MRKPGASGTKHLFKRHDAGCKNTKGDPVDCNCQWSGKYKGKEKVLSVWAKVAINTRNKKDAIPVLNRFKKAIDDKVYDPNGEHPAVGTEELFETAIDEWAILQEARGVTGLRRDAQGKIVKTSLRAMLGLLKDKKRGLGAMTLEQVASGAKTIETWLNKTGAHGAPPPPPAEGRKPTRRAPKAWSNKTWNGYRDLLAQICDKATTWFTVKNTPRLARNPMLGIDRRVWMQPEHFKQRLDDVEAALFAACDKLDRPQHRPNRNKLTQEKADAIRAALAAEADNKNGWVHVNGKYVRATLVKDLARRFKVSTVIISQIKHGEIWNPANIKVGTKGKEMRRRLIAALRAGLRAGEMMLIKLEWVNWRPLMLKMPDGSTKKAYEITLPAGTTKASKRTGQPEQVYATDDLARVLEERRFQLRANPSSRQYIFGTEDGRYQKSFMWHELFRLAGLDYGRDKGIVWHTTRHTFISGVADHVEENGLRDGLIEDLARIRDRKTAKLYMHKRRDERAVVIAGMNR